MPTATGGSYPTLASLKNLFPEGKYSAPIELLSQTNGILEYMPVFEGNLDTGERTTIRTGVPQGTWRKFNQGTQPVNADESQVEFRCGMLQTRMIADVRLVSMASDPGAYRADRLRIAMEGLNQKLAYSMFYESETTTPEAITGLGAYYNTTNTSTANSAENVIDAGGTGTDNQSIWLIGGGREATSLIYPRRSKAGMNHTDRGIQRIIDSTGISGAAYEAYEDVIDWDVGVAVRDWTANVRIANIDMSNLEAGSGADLGALIRKSQDYVYRHINKLKYFICMSPRTYRVLNEQRRTDVKNGGGLNYETVDGKRIAMYDGIPITIVDQLEVNEAQLT